MKPITLLLGFLLCLLVSGEAVAAKMNYAALAVVPKHGKQFHGLGYGSNVSQAQKAALSKCTSGRCQIVQIYRPGQCVHLVIGAYQIFWNNEHFDSKAGKEVMAFCKGQDPSCRKLTSKCLPK